MILTKAADAANEILKQVKRDIRTFGRVHGFTLYVKYLAVLGEDNIRFAAITSWVKELGLNLIWCRSHVRARCPNLVLEAGESSWCPEKPLNVLQTDIVWKVLPVVAEFNNHCRQTPQDGFWFPIPISHRHFVGRQIAFPCPPVNEGDNWRHQWWTM